MNPRRVRAAAFTIAVGAAGDTTAAISADWRTVTWTAAAARSLTRGVQADLHPVFGSVFSLVARSAVYA